MSVKCVIKFAAQYQGRQSEFGHRWKNFLRALQQGLTDTGKSAETQQTVSYARWPLPASVVNTTNHYLITSDTTEKDKKHTQYSRAQGPPPDHQAPLIGTGFALTPLDGTAHYVNEQMNVYFKTVRFHSARSTFSIRSKNSILLYVVFITLYSPATCFIQ